MQLEDFGSLVIRELVQLQNLGLEVDCGKLVEQHLLFLDVVVEVDEVLKLVLLGIHAEVELELEGPGGRVLLSDFLELIVCLLLELIQTGELLWFQLLLLSLLGRETLCEQVLDASNFLFALSQSFEDILGVYFVQSIYV